MGRRTLLVIASVLVAALGTAMIWMYVRSADDRARSDWRQLVPVLVATSGIEVGSSGTAIAERTAIQQVPRKIAPSDALTSAKQLGSRPTTVPILAGQFLIKAQFSETGNLAGVPDDRMAVSVSMDDPNRVAGLLHPGSRVAVYAVTTTKGGGRAVTMVLSDIRVIAVGATTGARNATGQAAKVGTQASVSSAVVTLDVDGREATALMYYQDVLYFTLLGKNVKGDDRHNMIGSAP